MGITANCLVCPLTIYDVLQWDCPIMHSAQEFMGMLDV